MPATHKTSFPWTGVCYACAGPSNRYSFAHRPSRSTVLLRGLVTMPDASQRTFPVGLRVEVCHACRARYKRTGSFWSSRARTLELATQIRAAHTAGLSIAAVSRALRVSRYQVEKTLASQDAS